MRRTNRTRIEGLAIFAVVSFAVAMGLSYVMRMWLACVLAFLVGTLAEQIYRGGRC